MTEMKSRVCNVKTKIEILSSWVTAIELQGWASRIKELQDENKEKASKHRRWKIVWEEMKSIKGTMDDLEEKYLKNLWRI